MSARRLAVAFLLSVAVPVSEAVLSGAPHARGSLAALAILPWMLLAPLPRRDRDASRGSAWREAVLDAAMALPPLFLGAGIDLARGAEPGALALSCSGAWLALLLWTAAAEHAARADGARAVFAALWLALLPGAAALRLALGWVPLRASADAPGPAPLFALDPLVWCHRWGRAGGLEDVATGQLFLATSAGLLVLLVVLSLRTRSSAEEGA